MNKISWHSTPIENIIQFDQKIYDQFIMDTIKLMMFKNGISSKEFNKKKLGKQKFCFLNTIKKQRAWIWENEKEGWRIVVDTSGLYFEVPDQNLTPKQAYESWKKYLNKIGLKI